MHWPSVGLLFAPLSSEHQQFRRHRSLLYYHCCSIVCDANFTWIRYTSVSYGSWRNFVLSSVDPDRKEITMVSLHLVKNHNKTETRWLGGGLMLGRSLRRRPSIKQIATGSAFHVTRWTLWRQAIRNILMRRSRLRRRDQETRAIYIIPVIR